MAGQVDEVIRPRRTGGSSARTDIEGRAARTIRGTQLEGAVGRGSIVGDGSDIATARTDIKGADVEGVQAGTEVDEGIRRGIAGVAGIVTDIEIRRREGGHGGRRQHARRNRQVKRGDVRCDVRGRRIGYARSARAEAEGSRGEASQIECCGVSVGRTGRSSNLQGRRRAVHDEGAAAGKRKPGRRRRGRVEADGDITANRQGLTRCHGNRVRGGAVGLRVERAEGRIGIHIEIADGSRTCGEAEIEGAGGIKDATGRARI